LDFLEYFDDNVDDIVYFAEKYSIKPLVIGTIRIKLHGLPNFLLQNVLYIPELQRSFLSLVHIRQQGHFVHMIGGKVEILKDSNNMFFVTRMEDGRLVKLNGTSTNTQTVAYLSHHELGIIPYSLLWHVRFGHINYDNIRLLRKNGVSSFPTIPRKLKQCDSCILGKHNKQPFHDSTSRACRKLELIHSDLCGIMLVPSANGNTYIMTFIDDYTRMRWVYFLKYKSQDFETFNNESYIASIKKELKKGFKMTYLGHIHYYLGIKVIQNPSYIFISHKKYIGELFNKFGMVVCNPVSTSMEQNLKLTSKEGDEFEDATKYRKLVGSLIYPTTTRLDISFVIGILSRFMQNPVKDIGLLEKEF
jgi:hypothetical protein